MAKCGPNIRENPSIATKGTIESVTNDSNIYREK